MLGSEDRSGPGCNNDVHLETDEVDCKIWKTFVFPFRPSVFDGDVFPLSETARDVLAKRCPNLPIDPDLLALVGIHPENPLEDDKTLIREIIARRLTD